MKYLFIILLTISPYISQCQTNANGLYWYNYTMKKCDELGLPKLFNTSPFHFRLWSTQNEVIEIWKDNDDSYHGQVTYWVTKCDSIINLATEEYYFKNIPLTQSQATSIARLISSLEIQSIPSDYNIEKWNSYTVNDGVSYCIEYSEKGNYTFKTYNNPSSRFETLKITLAGIITTFIDSTLLLSNNIHNLNTFRTNIPYDCYRIGGFTSVKAKIATQREYNRLKERNKRKQRKYNRGFDN